MDEPDIIQTSRARLQGLVDRVVDALRTQNVADIGKPLTGIVLGSMRPETFPEAARQVATRMGPLQRVGPMRCPEPNEARVPLEFTGGTRELRIVIDDEDNVIYLRLLAFRRPDPLPQRNETELRLPFNGSWLVYWGGDTLGLNIHRGVEFQDFAVDFIQVGEDGRSYRGEGDQNEDYYCYGQDIVAPAGGTIADVIQGVRDNWPGYMNPFSALGNSVLIRHRHQEYSLFAHLQWSSIRVAVGQSVEPGQTIGLCGNSGNSSEPHLHFHLQNTLLAHDARSIRPVFHHVWCERQGRVQGHEAYSPRKGDLVCPGSGDLRADDEADTKP